jgi:hypothetical protein
MPLLGGPPEVPCAKCGNRIAGLPWGELCPDCRAERQRRAARLGRWIGLAATGLAALYVGLRMPTDPMGRYYSLLAIVVTYILVRRIAARVAMELLK